MPFTFGCMVDRRPRAVRHPAVLRLLLQGRDHRAAVRARATGTSSLGVLGYVGSLLTAIYTFRMIFRAFLGDPSPRRASSRTATCYHAEQPDEPGDGRGRGHRRRLPGPRAPHRRARAADEDRDGRAGRRWRSLGGVPRRSPASTTSLHHFLEPTFADSSLYEELEPSGTLTVVGLLVGAADRRSPASSSPTRCGCAAGGAGARSAQRFAPLHRLFVEQVVLRRGRSTCWSCGRSRGSAASPRKTFERVVVNGALVGGTSGAVRAALGRRARACSPATCATTPRCSCSASPALGAYFLLSA